jgi:ketopantoate reductase
MPQYHISVLGGGSVGLCLAANFAQTGAEVTLLVRAGAVDELVRRPLIVSGLLGEHTIPKGHMRICDAARPDADVLSCDGLQMTLSSLPSPARLSAAR